MSGTICNLCVGTLKTYVSERSNKKLGGPCRKERVGGRLCVPMCNVKESIWSKNFSLD